MTYPKRTPEVDLHGLSPALALRKLAQSLHTARVQGAPELLVITGKGWGNRLQEPILRKQVEAWLRSPEGHRSGAGSVSTTNQGGALLVKLGS